MLKRLSIFILVLAGLQSAAQEVSASLKAAASVAPGTDLIVELSVNKPGVTGFMKYFQDLPANYTATDIDSKGGNFTFADNGAKVIWITPPSLDQFVMTYKISIPQGATGSLSLGGKFSYVVGNERKTFDLPEQAVSIGNTAAPAKETVKETPAPVETKKEPVETKAPVTEEKPIVTETKTPPAEEKPKPVEPKKEPVITQPLKTVPATAAASANAGKTYRVQIGAFSQKPQMIGVPELTKVVLDNGVTKYFSGNFKTYEEAKKRKSEMIEKGYQGAFIVSFENGVIVK